MPMTDFTVDPQKSHTCTKSCDHGAPRLTLKLFTHSGCSSLEYEHIWNLLFFYSYSYKTEVILSARRTIKSWTEQCVRSHGATGAVPERGELRQAHGLHMDVRLSVEPSAGVLQLNGVDLTQSHGMGQHCLVHRGVGLTAGHKHKHMGREVLCTMNTLLWVSKCSKRHLQPEPLLLLNIERLQRHLQLSALIQRRHLQLQQEVMSWSGQQHQHFSVHL